jgi:trans-aconitate methyltransferase
MRKYYNRFHEVYDRFVQNRNKEESESLLAKLEPRMPDGAKALDLGAGTGQSTIPFAKQGYKMTLLEISDDMLDVARHRKELRGCRFVRSDVRDIKMNEKFDLIYSINSFGCLAPYFNEEEMPSLYKKVVANLKQGGLLALSGYDYDPPKTLVKKIESGLVTLSGKKKPYKHKYFIGRKL